MEIVFIALIALLGWVYWIDSCRVERVATELLKEMIKEQSKGEESND